MAEVPLATLVNKLVINRHIDQAFGYFERQRVEIYPDVQQDFDLLHSRWHRLHDATFLQVANWSLEQRNMEEQEILNGLLQTARSIPQEIVCEVSDDVLYGMDDLLVWSNNTVRKNLLEYLDSYGFTSCILLLKALGTLPAPIQKLTEQYHELYWKFNNSPEESAGDWIATKEKFILFLKEEMVRLEQEQFYPGWKKLLWDELRHPQLLVAEPYYILFPSAEEIQKLKSKKQIDWPKYRRLLHLAQNAYKIEDYEQAYQYCLEIQTDIETDSTQLYEYLMMSFFHLSQKAEVSLVQKAFRGESKYLNLLFVYINRIKSLSIKAQQGLSPSSSQKIDEITHQLAIDLQRAINPVDYEYLFPQPAGSATEITGQRQAMEKYLDLGGQIVKYVGARANLVKQLLTEIAGSGHFLWVTTTATQQLTNASDFDAISLFRNLQHLAQDTLTAADQQAYLLLSLREKHLLLRERRVDEASQAAVFASASRWIRACQVAYLFYASEHNSKDFLQLAYDNELVSAFGLDWFELGATGEIEARTVTYEDEKINAKALFSIIVTELYGAEGWQTVAETSKRTAYDKLKASVERRYQEIRLFKNERDEELGRTQVIGCLRDWQRLYHAYGETYYLDQCVNELIGGGIYLWYELEGASIDEGHSLVGIEGYPLEVESELERLLSLTNTFDQQTAVKGICNHLFFRQVQYDYLTITPNPLDENAHREWIMELLSQVLFLYSNHANNEFLTPLYDELLQEKKYVWLKINEEGIATLDPDDDTALDLLEQLYLQGRKGGLPYDWDEFKLQIADNRYQELKHRYQDEFSILRRENWRLPSRVLMVEILTSCRQLYEATKKVRYLEYPTLEWVDNRGRIRWYRDLYFFFFQHWQNLEISGFNYRQERRLILTYLTGQPQQNPFRWARLIEIGTGK